MQDIDSPPSLKTIIPRSAIFQISIALLWWILAGNQLTRLAREAILQAHTNGGNVSFTAVGNEAFYTIGFIALATFFTMLTISTVVIATVTNAISRPANAVKQAAS